MCLNRSWSWEGRWSEEEKVDEKRRRGEAQKRRKGEGEQMGRSAEETRRADEESRTGEQGSRGEDGWAEVITLRKRAEEARAGEHTPWQTRSALTAWFNPGGSVQMLLKMVTPSGPTWYHGGTRTTADPQRVNHRGVAPVPTDVEEQNGRTSRA